MKIAYIGYDLSCTKSNLYFNEKDFAVTYFLKEKNQNFNYKPFAETDIQLEHLTIPGDSNLRTLKQKQIFQKIENEYLELKSNLNPQPAVISSESEAKNLKVLELSLIKDLQYDGKQKKIFIELEKKGVETFDFVLIEAHPFIANALMEKNIKAFRGQLELEYAWSSVGFAIDYMKPIESFKTSKTFFMVQDNLRKSLVDNWFFCDFQMNNKLNVWGYLPYLQVSNPEFKKFYIERVRKLVQQKCKFVFIKDFIQFDLSTVGAVESSASMKYNQMLAVPNFMFWSDGQVSKFLDEHFSKKMKSYQLAHEGVRRD